jgi:hypothetical protein
MTKGDGGSRSAMTCQLCSCSTVNDEVGVGLRLSASVDTLPPNHKPQRSAMLPTTCASGTSRQPHSGETQNAAVREEARKERKGGSRRLACDA